MLSLCTGSTLLSNHSQLDQGWHWDKVDYWALPLQNLWSTTWDKEHTLVICRYWAGILKAGLWFSVSHLFPSSPSPCAQKSRKTEKGVIMRINDAGMQIIIDFVATEEERESEFWSFVKSHFWIYKTQFYFVYLDFFRIFLFISNKLPLMLSYFCVGFCYLQIKKL